MGERRRLTVSLVVTGPVADEIDGLRRALGAGSLQRIAPHITLVPPLNVAEEGLEAVLAHVRGATSKSGPMSVAFGPPATFWPRTPVLYLEVGGDTGAVAALQADLAQGPLAPPPRRNERPFVAHLTLDQRISPALLPHAMAAMAAYSNRHTFTRVTVLQQDGAHRWWPLADATLGRTVPVRRGTLELEISLVERPDPLVAAWADREWSAYRDDAYGSSATGSVPYALVARSGGEIVGYCHGEQRGEVLTVARLIVSPSRRAQGAGSQLLRTVERLALERGCDRVRLEARAGSDPERFYRERGYRVVARLPAWNHGRDFVLMERPLFADGALKGS